MKDKMLFVTSIAFFLLYCLFILAVFSPIKHVFSPFIITIAIVYFVNPVVTKLSRVNVPAFLSTIMVYLIVLAGLGFVMFFALPEICEATIKVCEVLSRTLKNWGIDLLPTKLTGGNITGVYTTVVSIVKVFTDITVGAVAAFYILCDKDKVCNGIKELIPSKMLSSVKIMADDVKGALDSFFKGQLLIAMILFVIDSVFLLVMGIAYAPGLAAIAAVLDIIPYAGAFIGMAIIVLVTFTTAPEKLLIVVIGLLVIQQIENNFITPKISSDTLSLHPSITVLALYVGAFGGFWGLFLAIPLTCIFKKIAERFIQSIV